MSTHLSAACLRNTIDTPELVPPNGTDCCHQGEHTQGEPLMSTDNTMVQAEAKARKRKNNAGRRMKARNKNQKMREGPCESTSQEAKTIDQANGKESGYGQDARHTKEASAQLNGQEININKRNGEEDRALFIHESEVAAEQRAELCHVIKHEDDERIIEVEAPRVTKGDPYGTKWKKGKSRATKAQPASSGSTPADSSLHTPSVDMPSEDSKNGMILISMGPNLTVAEKSECENPVAFTSSCISEDPSVDNVITVNQKSNEVTTPKRPPITARAQIEALLRAMRDQNTAGRANRGTYVRGGRSPRGQPRSPTSRVGESSEPPYYTAPAASYPRGVESAHSITKTPQVQLVTMDASRPEADPVEIGYSTREVDQSQAATKVNATKRAILSTSAEPFSAATAVEKSSVQTPQKEAHHALDTPRTLAQCMAASSDLQATTSIETQVLQNDTASTHKVQDGAKGILNTSATSNSCVAASTDIQATMSIEEQIVQYNKATNLEGESSKAPKFSPLKPEYDEDGNYIPPHLRKHKRQLKKEDDEIGNRTPTRVKNQHQPGPGHSPGSPGTMKPESVATKSPVSTAAAMNQGALSAPTVATGAPRQELDFSVMKEHGEIENQTSPRVRIQHQSSPDHDLGSPGTMRPEPKSSASTAAAAVQGMRHGPAVVTGAPHQDFESSGEINPESVAVESSDLKGTTVIQNLSDDSIFATSPPQQDLESPGEIKPEPIVVRISSWKATDVVRDTPHVSAEMAAGTHGQAEKDTNETVNKASGSSPHTPGKYTILQKTDPSPGTASRSTPSRFKKPRRQSPWARAALPRKHISGDGSDAWDNKRVIASDDMNLADSNGWRRELENDDDERRLQDWDGKWMPAPVEWDARPAFNNTGAKFAESVDMWVKQRASEAVVQVNVEDSGFKDGLAIATGTDEIYEIIPRGEEGDTKLYPEDDYTATKLVQTSYSSSLALLAKTQTEQKDRQLDRKAKRTVSKVYRETYVAPPNDYIPKANIYIRPATVGDIAQIKDIYAWYISNTVVATERDQLDYASWRSRMQDIEDCKLPFLVAVTKSGRNNRRHVTYAEKIVGFGFADLFAGQFDAFKYAVEMQVFVHHHHKKVGVGMTLVDRLVAALDPLYMSRNGTDFFADNALDYEQGGRRIAGKILVTITYDANNDRDFQWQKKWLAEWDFEHVATLPRLGYKFDKFLNFAYLLKETGVTIGPGCGM